MLLQIANVTAVALAMLTTGADKAAAEEILADITCRPSPVDGRPTGSMAVIEGCKLYRKVDARGDSYYAVDGYDAWERDVDRALRRADALAATL